MDLSDDKWISMDWSPAMLIQAKAEQKSTGKGICGYLISHKEEPLETLITRRKNNII